MQANHSIKKIGCDRIMQDHSFKDYVADHLYNELFMALSGFLEENRGNLHVISQHVAAIDEANLSDIEIS